MAPKRARTAAASSSASSSSQPAATAVPKLTLHGGVPHHPSLAGLWRDEPASYPHLRAHETVLDLVCRLLLEKKKKKTVDNLTTIRQISTVTK